MSSSCGAAPSCTTSCRSRSRRRRSARACRFRPSRAREEVEVPAGAQSGQEIRLRGKGVPRLRGAGRGDLHVIVNVVVPTKLSKRERELLRELGEASGPAVVPKGGGSVFDRLRDLFT